MTPAGELLRDEILRSGPVSFHRFMEVALYHPEHGYYRRPRDPFGAAGDYYTAEQIQPVFGILIAARIRMLWQEMGRPEDFRVVELGAGRAEMAPFLSEFPYWPVDLGRGEWPEGFTGVVFANEFFDALPVHVAVRRLGGFREMRVGWSDGRFAWVESALVTGETGEYLRRYAPGVEEGSIVEINLDALRWIEEIARRLERGFLLAIDYGYTTRELVRFPRGTLMSYRRHTASEEVLAGAGERDITAHVNFSAFQDHAARCGLEPVRLESLAGTLVAAGEADQFAAALDAPAADEQLRRRMQLKTLLYGMGETFRTLLLSKPAPSKK
jgi:SAM-dependent MidA family methyltransferase